MCWALVVMAVTPAPVTGWRRPLGSRAVSSRAAAEFGYKAGVETRMRCAACVLGGRETPRTHSHTRATLAVGESASLDSG